MWAKVEGRIKRALNAIRTPFRGVLKRVNSTAAVQTVQLNALAGETLQDNELFQHYGFTSNPLPGTMGVVVPLGGNTSHGIIIATEHGKYRLTALESGEVALYTDEGARVVLKRGRIIETNCDLFKINCKTFEVNATDTANFNTPMLTASQVVTAGGNVVVDGSINSTADITASGKSLTKHTHTGNLGVPTSPPL